MNARFSFMLGLAICACSALQSQAVPFQNGGFELPEISGYTVLGTGSTAIAGWKVNDDGVIHAETPQVYWLNASEGDQLIVLNDDPIGNVSSLSQTFDTTPLTLYQITFDVSRESPADITKLDAPTFTLQATGNSAAPYTALQGTSWISHSYFFTATGSSTTLTISRTSAGEGESPVIDNLVLTAVPEPASVAMALFGGVGLMFFRRRRTK